MTPFQSLILGILQGATEFLPISSSGHLVIVPFLFGWHFPEKEAFVFDVLIQLGTLLAVLIYFWRDLLDIMSSFLLGLWHKKPFDNPQARLGWYLILATIPAGLAGLILKPFVEKIFNSPQIVAIFLIVMAVILWLVEKVSKRTRPYESINWVDALIMGMFQIAAILPGFSRSGTTISGGMLRNLERPAAARFSFLMSIPIMLAAGLLAGLDLLAMPDTKEILISFLPGFIAATIVGYIAIRWLLNYLGRHPLYIFSGYRILLGIITLIVASFK